jgi:hypothetical protein
MLRACFTPIALCFVYTSWHFYAFSGTNLLIRCQSASSCFLLFCVSEKLHKKYSRNWTERSPEFLFFPTRDGVQSRDGGGHRGGHTTWWRATPSGRARVWCGPLVHPLTSLFRLYILSEAKTLNSPVSVHESSAAPPPSKTNFGGQKSLFRHPAG